MSEQKGEVMQGTLDLMILRTLDTLGPLHGWGIARRIEQVSENALYLNQGTIYPALIRLEQQGCLTSEWGVSENNRKAKFFRITKKGRQQLRKETAEWWRMSGIMSRLLKPSE